MASFGDAGPKVNRDVALRLTDVVALMRHALKSASYKPALLKALVRVGGRHEGSSVSLEAIGREFTRMYWNQTVIYHLRQAASLSKESKAVQLIRSTAASEGVRNLEDLPEAARAAIDSQMARLLPVNVLEAFHTSKPDRMSRLYEWVRGSPTITIEPETRAFLRDNSAPLELIANYFWAEFLEGTNRLAPRILKKVGSNAAARTSLRRYLDILTLDRPGACFYCERDFDHDRPPVIDHVIPWSFLLEDPLWDLVLACRQCNAQKSDWLPATDLMQKLFERNRSASGPLRAHASFLIPDTDIARLYAAAESVEWPRYWTPR